MWITYQFNCERKNYIWLLWILVLSWINYNLSRSVDYYPLIDTYKIQFDEEYLHEKKIPGLISYTVSWTIPAISTVF